MQALGELAELDGKSAGLIARVLQPFLSVAILLMIVRIVLSWYPQVWLLNPCHAPFTPAMYCASSRLLPLSPSQDLS